MDCKNNNQHPHVSLNHPQRASWKLLVQDESGQDMIEYVLVASLLALAAISVVRGLGTAIASSYNSMTSNLTSNT